MCANLPRYAVLSTALFLTATLSPAQFHARASVATDGAEANGSSSGASLSTDGRFVAFASDASDLVSNDINGVADIFLHDHLTGWTRRVSVNSNGKQSTRASFAPLSVSDDGRYVAFSSLERKLVADDNNVAMDVFVHDTQTGTTERISVDSLGIEGNADSFAPCISGDGRFVVFESVASNLVANDLNGAADVFLHDRDNGTTERVSIDAFGVEGNGDSMSASVSEDGRYVCFESSADNLVANDTNAASDIFVYDRQLLAPVRVSVDSAGTEANGASTNPAMSADGNSFAYTSDATNLTTVPLKAPANVYFHDRASGATQLVSIASWGTAANKSSFDPSISDTGLFVAFSSRATNLDSPNTGGWEIFTHNTSTGLTKVLSRNDTAAGNGHSEHAAISGDGGFVVFETAASNLVPNDTNGVVDIILSNRFDNDPTDSIVLSAPSTVPVGSTVDLTWSNARSGSQYWLFYSTLQNGFSYAGHSFDIGPGITVIDQGNNTPMGEGSFQSIPIPPGMAGQTIYVELGALDAGGITWDSNAVSITVL